MATAAGCSGRRRQFAAACGVLRRCVRAKAAAGNNKMAAEAHNARAAASTMLLMPGADVAPDVRKEAASGATPPARAQLTIMHGGRVMVFDDVPADKAAELVRVAAGHGRQGILGGMTDVPVVARKGSLQRFMEKRQDRIATQSPYVAASEKRSGAEAYTAGC